jgi:N-acetylglucosaminyldiphosphoundecaprenol N-acetyl-beta-D-mannosaminyltransferase
MKNAGVLEATFYEGTKSALISEIFEAIDGGFSYLVTPNVNHACLMENDPEFQKATGLADIRVCDSRILAPFLRMNGKKNVLEFPGSDLTMEVLKEANAKKLTVALIGGQSSDVGALSKVFPDLALKQYIPPMGFINDEKEVQKVIAFSCREAFHLMIFAVGSPRGEVLAMLIKQSNLSRGFGICSGAAISFISGRVSRAPIVLRRMRMEWIYRIVIEPRRLLGRYIGDGACFLRIIIRSFFVSKIQ